MPLPLFTHRPPTSDSNAAVQSNGLGSRIQQLWPIRAMGGRNIERPETPEGPKTPQLPLEEFPPSRLVIPGLSRASSTASRAAQYSVSPTINQPTSPRPPYSPYSQPVSPTALRDIEHEAEQASPAYSSEPRRFVGVGPEEQELGQIVDARRRRRRRAQRQQGRKCEMQNQKIRHKLISACISGGILVFLLSAYLGLALSNRIRNQQFSILVILVILIDTIFFCHALIRLGMLCIKPPSENDMSDLPAMVGPNGYANPAQPIPVALARDEEAAGIESDATKMPPPAYGLWRESVRVDPNRIYWQRNASASPTNRDATENPDRPMTARRPPSYISEHGVNFRAEEEARTLAAVEEVQALPPHPSEMPSDRERARRTMQQRQSTWFVTGRANGSLGGLGHVGGGGFA